MPAMGDRSDSHAACPRPVKPLLKYCAPAPCAYAPCAYLHEYALHGSETHRAYGSDFIFVIAPRSRATRPDSKEHVLSELKGQLRNGLKLQFGIVTYFICTKGSPNAAKGLQKTTTHRQANSA